MLKRSSDPLLNGRALGLFGSGRRVGPPFPNTELTALFVGGLLTIPVRSSLFLWQELVRL
jgi:hypothetical protein